MSLIFLLVLFASILALCFAAFNYFTMKRMSEGSEEMSEIAAAIRVGANAFIHYEYKILYLTVIVVAAVLSSAYYLACRGSSS